MVNLLFAMMTLVKITSTHNVTMTMNDNYIHHTIYNYNYTEIYVDEIYRLDETTGEWYRD